MYYGIIFIQISGSRAFEMTGASNDRSPSQEYYREARNFARINHARGGYAHCCGGGHIEMRSYTKRNANQTGFFSSAVTSLFPTVNLDPPLRAICLATFCLKDEDAATASPSRSGVCRTSGRWWVVSGGRRRSCTPKRSSLPHCG